MRLNLSNRAIPLALLLATAASLGTDDDAAPYEWKPLDKVIGSVGVLKDDVCTFTVPRNDLDVAVDGMAVPAAAGIASEFRFFRCSCGKTRVVGQFCCADYEVNDVLDAIRPAAMIQVASVSPMFLADKPRVMIVRFQGEGEATALARLLKAGLDWTGDARLTAQAATPATTRPTAAHPTK
jgi:hypothetical protein